jgi:hypothetical protein
MRNFMDEKTFQIMNDQKMVKQSRIGEIFFWRFYLSFFQVAEPGRKGPYHIRGTQDVDVGARKSSSDPKPIQLSASRLGKVKSMKIDKFNPPGRGFGGFTRNIR